MADPQLLLDLVLAVVAAFVGGALAHRVGQPVIIGYLVGGVVIGPFTPGPTASQESVQVLAEVGVALLMFSLGAEVSIAELRRIGRVAVFGGSLQIVLTMGLGPLLAPWLGLNFAQGVFLGALLALSSTVVAMKVLLERGELGALHGRIALGILIAQDLAIVPMVVVLPAVVSGSEHLLADLGIATLKAAAVVAAAYVIGVRLVPIALDRAAITRTRELFLLGHRRPGTGYRPGDSVCWTVTRVRRVSGWSGGGGVRLSISGGCRGAATARSVRVAVLRLRRHADRSHDVAVRCRGDRKHERDRHRGQGRHRRRGRHGSGHARPRGDPGRPQPGPGWRVLVRPRRRRRRGRCRFRTSCST